MTSIYLQNCLSLIVSKTHPKCIRGQEKMKRYLGDSLHWKWHIPVNFRNSLKSNTRKIIWGCLLTTFKVEVSLRKKEVKRELLKIIDIQDLNWNQLTLAFWNKEEAHFNLKTNKISALEQFQHHKAHWISKGAQKL